jgi:hypothetical protein
VFKSVEYAGFDGRPDLKAKAEQLTPVLADEVRSAWRDRVRVLWSPAPADPGSLNLTLALTIETGASGSALGTFSPKDLADAYWLRSRCRDVWGDLLGVLLDEQHKRVEEAFLEPAEA